MHFKITIIFLALCIGCNKEAPIDYRDAYTGTYTCQLHKFHYDYLNSRKFYVYDSSNGIIQITKLKQDSMVDLYFGEGLRLDPDKLITNELLIRPIGKEIKISHHIPFKIEKNLKLSTFFDRYSTIYKIDSINPETKTFHLYFELAQIDFDNYFVRITGKKN